MNKIVPYLTAEYVVDGLETPIRVGQMNKELESLIAERDASEWCFITAWNPMSVVLPRPDNDERNAQLREMLVPYDVINGEGRDPNGEWEAEKSFLVFDIPLNVAVRLAKLFNQRAILHAQKGDVCELIETD